MPPERSMTIEIPGLIAWILIGLVAGWLASTIMKRKSGLLKNLLLGLVGALVGGVLFSLLGLSGSENVLGSIFIATVGAVIVLAIVG
jgi:uncharacterized membrane protein YeaQ/YmgE (transglycosylase-associated protein family)